MHHQPIVGFDPTRTASMTSPVLGFCGQMTTTVRVSVKHDRDEGMLVAWLNSGTSGGTPIDPGHGTGATEGHPVSVRDHRARNTVRRWLVGSGVVIVILAIVLGPVLARDASTSSDSSSSSTATVPSTGSLVVQKWAKTNIDFIASIYDEVNTFATAANKCSSESSTTCGSSVGGACSSLLATVRSAQHAPVVPDSTAEQD